ncbi:MAG: LacI family DNA-binding transcriptional regulator [Bacteroidetes bacterium]|nr:LacI family DNA-binding transcriptional regulator [Bacteroidota bacterium]
MQNIDMNYIAVKAGVSLSTVSRCIHSPHLVKESTRKKILSIMQDHNYVYNAHAAEFSKKKTSMVGLIIPTVKSSIFAEFIDGIQNRLKTTSFSLTMGYSNYSKEEELKLINVFLQRRFAGMIVVGIKDNTHDTIISAVKNKSISVVSTWEVFNDPIISCVGFDNRKASYRMTKYLLSLGHKKIAIILGPYSQELRVKRRLDGYIDALKESKIELNPDYIIETIPTLFEGKAGMERLLDLDEPPTAVFAASDVLAMGSIKAVQNRNLKVPEDISIAGFDNIDHASYCSPPLTTVKVPAYEMGDMATQLLITNIENENREHKRYILDTDIIIRESCRPLG